MRIGMIAVQNCEESLLQRLCDRSATTLANDDLVKRAHRRDFYRGAAEECLVSQVQELAWNRGFAHLEVEVLRQCEHRVAGDALQH